MSLDCHKGLSSLIVSNFLKLKAKFCLWRGKRCISKQTGLSFFVQKSLFFIHITNVYTVFTDLMFYSDWLVVFLLLNSLVSNWYSAYQISLILDCLHIFLSDSHGTDFLYMAGANVFFSTRAGFYANGFSFLRFLCMGT